MVVEVKHLGEELPKWLSELRAQATLRFSKFAEGMVRLGAGDAVAVGGVTRVFIDFEGIDGSGKTTLSNILAEQAEERGYRVTHAREGGELKAPIARRLREMTRDPVAARDEARAPSSSSTPRATRSSWTRWSVPRSPAATSASPTATSTRSSPTPARAAACR